MGDQSENLILEGGENKTINMELKPLSQVQREQQERIAARKEARAKLERPMPIRSTYGSTISRIFHG